MRHCERVADAGLRLFAFLLRGGGSVAAARSYAIKLCAAYGVKCLYVSAKPRSCTICVECGDEVIKRTVRYIQGVADLKTAEECGKILNDAESGAPLDVTERRLRSIDNISGSICLRSAGGGLACGAFCAFFGGGALSFSAAFLTGLAVCYITFAAEKMPFGMLRLFLSAFAGGTLCIIFSLFIYLLKAECNLTAVIFGSIMPVIPGLKMCRSLQDIAMGDILSGAFGILTSLVSTAAISFGYALSINFFSAGAAGYSLGGAADYNSEEVSSAVRLFSAALGSAGFCIMFNAALKRAIAGAAAGFFGYAAYALCIPCGEYAALFISALASSFSASLLSAVFKVPTSVFLIPSLVPLVPGIALFCTAQSLICGDLSAAFVQAAYALHAFSAVAAGGIISFAAEILVRRISSFARLKKTLRRKKMLPCRVNNADVV